MCNYHCPFAERKPCAGFLLCRDMYKDGVNYNARANAMTVICAFQKQCMATGRMENTDTAKECYRMRLEAKQAKAEAVHEESVHEESPAEDAPKKRRASKKTN